MNRPLVEDRFSERMTMFGKILDHSLNHGIEPPSAGFALLVFDLDGDGMLNYVTNADRNLMITALKEMVAQLEGRMPEGVGHS